jgi:hypothetical protein
LFESCFIFIFFLLFIIIIFFLLVVSPTASTEPRISGAIAAQFGILLLARNPGRLQLNSVPCVSG